MSSLDIKAFTKKGVPRLSYDTIAKQVLPGWEISLVFAGRARATSLNKVLRKKSYAPNVLSYVTGHKSGEVIICPEVAASQAASYDMTHKKFITYLFIHGLLHLKGLKHGTTMEKQERALILRVAR